VVRGSDFLSISPIGSEAGTLTATVTKDGEIILSRGCFKGSISDFEAAVKTTHGDNQYAKEYGLVITLIKAKLEPIAAERQVKEKEDAA